MMTSEPSPLTRRELLQGSLLMAGSLSLSSIAYADAGTSSILQTRAGKVAGVKAKGVHVFKGMAYESAFREVEAALADLGGRPHWGKRSFLSAAELAPRYPRWHDFQAVRARLDPRGRFANAWVRDVLG